MPTIKKRGSAAKNQPEREFLTIAHHVSEFIATYKKYVWAVSLAVIAVLLITAGYSAFRSMQEKKAAPLVAAAYEYYSASSGKPADYQKALELFREVQKKYSGTMNGAIAQYYVGNCLDTMGQSEEAIKEYKNFIQEYSSEKFLLSFVYQRMGSVYVGQKKQADAIKAFEQAEKISGPGATSLELAKLYEASGNVSDAQKEYKLVAEKLAGTSWAMEAILKLQKTMPVPDAAKGMK
jgi:tetratricopeptide (TPR) repeat protein